jgi:integrase
MNELEALREFFRRSWDAARTDPHTFRALNVALTELYRLGRLDLLRAVRKLTETPRRGNPLTVKRAGELAAALGGHGPALWALCLTGMRRGEYWGKWEVMGDRVLIHGTKTAGSERFVPLIRPITAAPTTYWGFAQALRKLTGGFVRVHDLRKTFGSWCDNAGVSKARTRLYLGHGRRDISDLYTESDVRDFLSADVEKLQAFLAEQSREKSREQGRANLASL